MNPCSHPLIPHNFQESSHSYNPQGIPSFLMSPSIPSITPIPRPPPHSLFLPVFPHCSNPSAIPLSPLFPSVPLIPPYSPSLIPPIFPLYVTPPPPHGPSISDILYILISPPLLLLFLVKKQTSRTCAILTKLP